MRITTKKKRHICSLLLFLYNNKRWVKKSWSFAPFMERKQSMPYSDGTLLLAKVINRLDLVLLSFVLLLLADGLGRGFFIDINIY